MRSRRSAATALRQFEKRRAGVPAAEARFRRKRTGELVAQPMNG
jgi:hypothetical protein